MIFELRQAVVLKNSAATARVSKVFASTINIASVLPGTKEKHKTKKSTTTRCSCIRFLRLSFMMILVPTNRRPITPGAVLRKDFLEPLNLTQGKAAEALGIDRTSLNELLNGRRNVTTEMALRLGHAFGTSPQYWLNLQIAVELFDAQQSEVVAEIERQPVLASRP